MSIQGLVNVVKEAAPLVARVIGGANPLVGLLLSSLGSIFGVTNGDPVALAGAISADTDAKVKLQEFELKHQEILQQYSAQDYATEVDDRKDARKRDESIVLAGKTDWVLSSIAVIVVVGFFMLCMMNYFYPIRDDHVLIMLIGQVSSGFLLVLSFYFGSSKSQK